MGTIYFSKCSDYNKSLLGACSLILGGKLAPKLVYFVLKEGAPKLVKMASCTANGFLTFEMYYKLEWNWHPELQMGFLTFETYYKYQVHHIYFLLITFIG